MTHATAFTPAEIGGLARRIDRPVVLVGLMGVGKSTVGRRLAALLDTDFIDVDEEIERAADRSVSEIFEAHGELYFRAGERDRLEAEWVAKQPPLPQHTYVENGIRDYRRSLRRKLLWGVYIVPIGAILLLIYLVNYA